jgi:DNA-binding NtrC family response regulator
MKIRSIPSLQDHEVTAAWADHFERAPETETPRPTWAGFDRDCPQSHGAGQSCCNVLIFDDQPAGEHLQNLLQNNELVQVHATSEARAARKALVQTDYHLILIALRSEATAGMEFIDHLRQGGWPGLILAVVEKDRMDLAGEAAHRGASAILIEPITASQLRFLIERATREQHLHEEVARLRQQLADSGSLRNVLSKNPRMHAVFELIQNVAATTTPILIEGERGTGKEEVARAIHRASLPWRPGPLTVLHCGLLPADLLHRQLFGPEANHARGSLAPQRSYFEQAAHGTLLLKEIGELPAALQKRLAEFLNADSQEQPGSDPLPDVRLVATTHRNLARLVKRGWFREDLYQALAAVKIRLPPLRNRPEDIPLLAAYFVANYSRAGEPRKAIAPAAMDRLLRHTWPINVRELETVLERACITARGPSIDADDLVFAAPPAATSAAAPAFVDSPGAASRPSWRSITLTRMCSKRPIRPGWRRPQIAFSSSPPFPWGS